MESLGEAQETADFFTGYAAELERNQGYDLALPDDPLPSYRSHNRTVLKPHGVWGVIVPFNFPLALGGGPTAAALVTGNTVVLKGATDTPWAGRLLADCIRDAGFPAGVFNYVTGPGSVVGETPWRATPTSPASPSPAPTRSACGCIGPWRAGRTRVPASPRWAARTPAS